MINLQTGEMIASTDSQRNKEVLRIIICGRIESNRSMSNYRFLFDGKAALDKPLESIGRDSDQTDSNAASDTAYHCFATEKRRYIVADAPDHECTRDLVTAASAAHLAVIFIDASKGIYSETLHYSRIAALMGIQHLVLVIINKMGWVNDDETTFNTLVSDFLVLTSSLEFSNFQAIPISCKESDNAVSININTAWYKGASLLDYLDTIEISDSCERSAFRMQVRSVNQLNNHTREICGQVVAGSIRTAETIRILPAGEQTCVKGMLIDFDEVDAAYTGDSVALTLVDEVDVTRGDVLVAADKPPEIADQFEANLLWMNKHSLVPGRQFLMKLACKEVTMTVTHIKYQKDINTGAHLAANTLELNETARVNLSTSAPLVFERDGANRALGSFIVLDKLTLETVGVGMIDFALRRASNIHWQALELNKAARAEKKYQRPKCIWFTGLSGSGKSTIANLLEKRLHQENKHTYLLDGDNVRHGLNRDLGFTEADRVENIRRIAEVAKLMVDAGLIVLVSFISPFRSERRMARELFVEGEFIEVFVDTALDECERRDVKGLYAKARRGDLKNFTGIDSPYESPESPEVHIQTTDLPLENVIEPILKLLK